MRLRCAALRIVQAPPAGAVCCLLRIVLGVGYVLTATLLAVCLTAATLSANTWKWRVENVDTAGNSLPLLLITMGTFTSAIRRAPTRNMAFVRPAIPQSGLRW